MDDIDLYIEKFCVKHEIPKDEAYKYACVRNAAEYYEKEGKKCADIAKKDSPLKVST